MKIEDYSIQMNSRSEIFQTSRSEERLVVWQGDTTAQEEAYRDPVSVELSDKAKELLSDPDKLLSLVQKLTSGDSSSADQFSTLTLNAGDLNGFQAVNEVAENKDSFLSELDEFKLELIEELLAQILGEDVDINSLSASDLASLAAEFDLNSSPDSAANQISAANFEPLAQFTDGEEEERVGWGLDYYSREEQFEAEKMSFRAEGIIKTADGMEISIDVKLNMSRAFYQSQETSIKAGDALLDPLVINYSGSAAQLSDYQTIEFDLDMDGKKEEIAALEPGSGYLALDRNGDGKINDGSELFGPSTNNGFAELADYDEDGNGWIDENDSVFSNLKIWSRTNGGEDVLTAIGKVGVGAIYLGSAGTEFSFKDITGDLKGKVAKTGIYLKENGGVGTVQEIDLTV
jgi:hypothetical protein